MSRLKKCISSILVLALLLSIAVVPGYANVRSTFGITLEATSDASGNSPVEYVKKGDTFYVYVRFSGNNQENNVCAFDLYISYDNDLITVSRVIGVGPCSSASANANKNGHAFINWASENGLVESSGFEESLLESGSLAALQCVAKADITKSDIAGFRIVNDDVSESFFVNSDKEELEYTNTSLDLPILAPNSILVYSAADITIAAPYAGEDNQPQSVNVEYKAIVTGEDGNIANENVEWSVSETPEGVTVEGGTVTVTSKANRGEYTINAVAGDKTGSATLEVTKEPSLPSRIQGNEPGVGFDTNLKIPADNAADKTVRFSIYVWDQYGVEIQNPSVTWELEPSNVPGVSLSNDGLLTITNAATNSIADGEGTEFAIKASCGELGPMTTKVTVKRADPVATSVAIYKDEEVVTSDSIAIPTGDTVNEVTYSAKVLDQYGSPMDSSSVMWSSNNSLSGVNVSDGKVTVSNDASTGSFTLTATYSDGVEASLTLNVVTIAFSGQDAAVSAVDSPIYGMTWGEIIKVNDSAISAKVGETQVEGTYSVENADTIPDAGNSVEYRVIFTSNDGNYVGVEVARGTVEIAQKPVTVSGITANDKVYDGTTVAKLNTDSASIGGKVDNDDVTIDVANATGTFDTENVGTGKTVTISGIALGGNDAGNYKLSSDSATTTANITAKELTANVSSVSVTKEYDGTTAAGTVNGAAKAETVIIGETVTVNVSAGEYADKNVGTNKTVTLTLSLSGDNASNYTLSNKTAVIETASITPSSSITDATATEQNVVVGVGTFTEPSFTGIGGEAVTGTTTYIYNSSTMDKAAIESELERLAAGDTATISYSFNASGNYTGTKTGEINVTMVDIAFTDVEEAVTVASDAVYGDTWANIVTVDDSKITATVGTEKVEGTYTVENSNARPNAGTATYKVLFTSTDGRYTDVEVDSGTVTVAKKSVTITGLKVENKEYDGDADAAVTGTAALDGVLADDNVTVIPGDAVFESKDVGINKTVDFSGYSLSGMDAGNYTLSAQPSATASITPKPVTITGVDAEDKTYDGTTTAQITGTPVVSGKIDSDDVNVVNGSAAFASADVGTNIAVSFSGFSLSGADAGNYELTAQPVSVTANITKADYTNAPELNINIIMNQADAQTGTLTALNFFGGNMPAEATITNVVLDSVDNSIIESISVDNGSLAYSSATNITTEGTVETYNVTISTRNYNDITATLTFTTVAKTPVTISGVSVADKVYNGQAVSYIGTPTAAANGETVEVSAYTYTWQNAEGNVLSAAPVNAGSYKLVIAVAADDPNYVGSATVSFTISKATVTVTVDDKEAYVGSDMPELTYTVSGLASGESLAVNPTLTCNADMDKPGEYAITASGAAVPATGNYNETITYVPGTLTVSRRPINVGPTYDIDVVDSDNGSVKASLGNASEGSVITLTVTPDDGYKLGSITVIDENGDEVEVRRSGSEYKFTMPDSDVRVSARFVRDTGALPFNDVNAGDWFYDYVEYVYNNGIMDGVDSGVFSPNTETTRGMVVTILYRLAGEPNVRGGNDFSDVASGAYYADAVTWASNAGIVNGTSATTFSPNALVTREQFAAMLYRYMQYTGADTSARASLSGFADAGKVSPYAADAVAWAVAEDVLNGRSATEIAPQGNCTRAEVAAMITRVFG